MASTIAWTLTLYRAAMSDRVSPLWTTWITDTVAVGWGGEVAVGGASAVGVAVGSGLAVAAASDGLLTGTVPEISIVALMGAVGEGVIGVLVG